MFPLLIKAFQKLHATQEMNVILYPLVAVAIAAVVPTPNLTTCGPRCPHRQDLVNPSLALLTAL